ncbi:MAG TPA: DUF3842 family protein [Nitrospirae bacterium]|nr:DUF3842 family protein [Nitrospirota bacterium]
MKKIAVIDGQGGGIGTLITKRLREEFVDSIEIIALGTNSTATASMMKSKANRGATGENAIIVNASKVDVIVGPLSILLPNAMFGEMTEKMAVAISLSPSKKILLPLNQESIEIVGTVKEPLPHLIEKLIDRIKEVINV